MKLVGAPFYNALCYFILKEGKALPNPDTEINTYNMKSSVTAMVGWSSTIEGSACWGYMENFFRAKYSYNYNYEEVQNDYLKEIAELDKKEKK